MGKDGILRFRNIVCVPWGPRLRKRILEEGHKMMNDRLEFGVEFRLEQKWV